MMTFEIRALNTLLPTYEVHREQRRPFVVRAAALSVFGRLSLFGARSGELLATLESSLLGCKHVVRDADGRELAVVRTPWFSRSHSVTCDGQIHQLKRDFLDHRYNGEALTVSRRRSLASLARPKLDLEVRDGIRPIVAILVSTLMLRRMRRR